MNIRIATYNVHKCRGLDGRRSVVRIADVIKELECDIVAVQEVISVRSGVPEDDQAAYFGTALEYNWAFGDNRPLRGGTYGNLTLSRFQISHAQNYDLSCRGRERRGCLRTDIAVKNETLHVFNVHLGTSFFERRQQGHRMVSNEVLHAKDQRGPRIVVGDFNEWTRGLASRLMGEHFQSLDARLLTRFGRTYPGILPVLHLDHFYFDDMLTLVKYKLHRSRRALVASDHLPIVAEFALSGRSAAQTT